MKNNQKKISSLLLGLASFATLLKTKALAITNPVVGTLGDDAGGAADGSIFVSYFVTIWQAVITVGSILVLVYFIWGAIAWITAGGDSGKIETARNRITQSILGLILLVSSFVIIEFISNLFFGGEFSILKLEFISPGGI